VASWTMGNRRLTRSILRHPVIERRLLGAVAGPPPSWRLPEGPLRSEERRAKWMAVAWLLPEERPLRSGERRAKCTAVV
jgi:hypothetical protein